VTRLLALDPATWEHPHDRAALQRIRAVPGLEALVMGLGSAVVDPAQKALFARGARPASALLDAGLWRAWQEVCEALDVTVELPIDVLPQEHVNAAVVCAARPRLLVTQGLLDASDHDILRVVLAHELGHLLSGHLPWKLGVGVLLGAGAAALGTGLGIAVGAPILLTMRRWDRFSELSADRAAVLAVQDPDLCQRVLWRLAGADRSFSDFRSPTATTGWARARGLLSRHPRPGERAEALDDWVADGALSRVLSGEYVRRGEAEPSRPWRGLFAAFGAADR